jgi:probable DNA repair protein
VANSTEELEAGVVYVTPTRRLAHHLRARHDAACIARGLQSWPTPDVITWSLLMRRLFDADRVAGRRHTRWLDDAHGRLAWEAIVRRDRDLQNVLLPAGLGARAHRSWQLLHDHAMPRDAVDEDPGPETQAYSRWAREFERWLREGAWFDPATAAAAVGAPQAGTRLHCVGFDELLPAQEACLRRFAEAGCEVQVDAPASTPPAATVLACRDFAAELDAAARWAAALLERQPQSRVAVVVPELGRRRAEVRRAFDRVFAPAAALTGGPLPESSGYELAAAQPLGERPVIEAALAWLAALSGEHGLAACSQLLRGSHDAAAADERYARAELDAWARGREPGTAGLGRVEALARQLGCPQTAVTIRRALDQSADWPTITRLPSEWATAFAATLHTLGWPGAEADSVAFQAVQRWRQLLGEFAAADDVAGPLRATAALVHLRELCQSTAFEPQEIAAPLLLIDPDTVAGMRFDALWISGLDAARWPAAAVPDPFLPRAWQARCRVPGASAEIAAARSRRTFDRLCASADEVVCSVPQFEDASPLLPSALLAGLPPVERLPGSWDGPAAARAIFDARPPLETLQDGALPPYAEHEIVKGGARLLELQAACPFRAAVELRLGGGEFAEPGTGLQPTERGSLLHDVLQRFWDGVRTQEALLAMSNPERAMRVHEAAEQSLEPLRRSADPVRLRLLEIEQGSLERRVLELLALDAARAPFEVIATEASHTVAVGSVQVRLKLDRVDRLSDGSLAVIDYKTGGDSSPSAWMGERPAQPQLPLYVRAVGEDQVKAVAFGVVRKGATAYAGYVHEPTLFPGLTGFDPGRAPFDEHGSWKGMLESWRRRLDAIAAEHARGDARLATDRRKACRYCHLPAMCRAEQGQDHAGAEAGDDAG